MLGAVTQCREGRGWQTVEAHPAGRIGYDRGGLIQGQGYRKERLEQIAVELGGLADRRGPSTESLVLRKRQDWAA